MLNYADDTESYVIGDGAKEAINSLKMPQMILFAGLLVIK